MSEECVESSQDTELSVFDREAASDDALLWQFLALMCQQNGVLVPSDISELLMKESSISTAKSPVRGVGVGGVKEEDREEDAFNEFRQFLLAGRKKDALELACKRSLWGHALMLSSRMDDQSRTYVVNRFTASLPTTDPLNTFYTMMLGRTPSIVRPEGLCRAGNWKSHLAMMVANNQDRTSIGTLGDSLLSQGRVCAAHLCYHLSGLKLGSDDTAAATSQSKYSLLGIKPTSVGGIVSFPEPEDLCRTEVFEYALGLSRADFTLPSFQKHKLLHAIKLFEYGLLEKALRYCESIAYYVTKDVRKYNQTFLTSLQELSTRLHYASCPLGVMETELPSWIIHLEQSMNDSVTDAHTPPPSRDSPSLASAGKLATNNPPLLTSAVTQEMFGNYLQVPHNTAIAAKVTDTDQTGSQTNLSTTYTPVNMLSVPQQPFEQQQHGNQPFEQQQHGNQPFEQQQHGNLPFQQQQHENQTYEQQQHGNQTYEQQLQYQFNPEQPDTAAANDQQLMGVATYQTSVDQQPITDQQQQQQQPEVSVNTAITDPSQPFTYGTDDSSWPGYGGQQQQQQLIEGSYGMGYDTNTQGALLGVAAEGGVHLYTNTEAEQEQDMATTTTTTGRGLMSSNQYPSNATATPPFFSSQPAESITPTIPPDTTTTTSNGDGDGGTDDTKETTEQEEEETKKKVPDSNAKPGQSGWLGGLFNWIPKGSKNAHLPKDKNKKIIFDKEKNKWINLDEGETEDAQPTAPPTDNELMKQKPSNANNSASVHTHTDNQTDSPSTAHQQQPPSSNLYSRSRLGRGGRLGARSMYVDVLNPGGTKKTSSGPGGPPPPSLMPPMMSSLGPTPMNPGSFFVGSGPTSDIAAGTAQDTQNNPPVNQQAIQQQQQQVISQEEETPKSASSSTSIEFPEDKTEQPQPAPSLPQFFNPNAFSSANQMSVGHQVPNKRDPFPDNVSEVSEYSLEVSRINKQASNRGRPRYQYPSTATTTATAAPPFNKRPQYPSSMNTAGVSRPAGYSSSGHQQGPPPPPGVGSNWL